MESSIFRGLRNAFEVNKELQGFEYADLKPEYLLTCQVAFQIRADYPDYKIKLEDSTKSFKAEAGAKIDIINYSEFQKKYKITRNGSVDIGIYDANFRSICPIEIKLINPQREKSHKDLLRLIEYLDDNNNGTISDACFVYIFKEKIFTSNEQIPQDIAKAIENTNKLIDKDFAVYKNQFQFKIFAESIGGFSNFENINEMDGIDPYELGEFINEHIHFVGVIIKINKL